MKINKPDLTCSIADFKPGDVFRIKSDYFMLTETIDDINCNLLNAVNLETGELVYITNANKPHLCRAELEILPI